MKPDTRTVKELFERDVRYVVPLYQRPYVWTKNCVLERSVAAQRCPQLPRLAAARPSAVEARYDVLAGLPQVFARPRARTPNCFCGDAVFRAVYGGKLDEKALASRPTAESTTEAGVA